MLVVMAMCVCVCVCVLDMKLELLFCCLQPFQDRRRPNNLSLAFGHGLGSVDTHGSPNRGWGVKML